MPAVTRRRWRMGAAKTLANVKVDALLLREAKLRAAERSLREGRTVTVQEIFAAALARYLGKKPK
jgi:hypothetical protein